MAIQYAYNYAVIDETGYCYEIFSSSRSHEGEEYHISIPELHDDYLEKYYINGAWYYDAEGTQPWTPPTE